MTNYYIIIIVRSEGVYCICILLIILLTRKLTGTNSYIGNKYYRFDTSTTNLCFYVSLRRVAATGGQVNIKIRVLQTLIINITIEWIQIYIYLHRLSSL